MKRILFLSLIALLTISSRAQTAQEIADNYFEAIGGMDNWKQLEGFKMDFTQAAQGFEFGGEMIALKNGMSMVHMNIQGNDFYQNVFDGENLWGTNFINMQAEKVDSERLQNYKNNEAKEFPDPLLHYSTLGYNLVLEGSEEIDGVDCYKLKLTKKPILRGGVEEENINFYYIDKDSYLVVAKESVEDYGAGPQAVMSIFGDFDEVNGLVFPFSISSQVDGQEVSSITISAVELNPDIDPSSFSFPE